MHAVCCSNYLEDPFRVPKIPDHLLCIMPLVLLLIKMSVFALAVFHNDGLIKYP